MVARQFIIHHNDSQFPIDYDTDDGLEVLKFQIFSLTSILPEEQKILVEDQNLIVTESSDLESISDKLRLVSIQEEQVEEKKESSLDQFDKSDEELARILQAEEEALFFQQYRASEDREAFGRRVRPYVKQALMYEDPVRQEAACKSVPVSELKEKSLVSLEGKFKPSKEERDHAFLLQLLFWIKQSFRWVNSPPCDNCGSETSNIGMGAPLPSEIDYGGSRVELYRLGQRHEVQCHGNSNPR